MKKPERTLRTGLLFPESLRWKGNRLWLSDQHAHQVHRLDASGRSDLVVDMPDLPSGLGFLPDGSALVAAMRSRRILRIGEGEVHLHADLSGLGAGWLNDMVVDENSGRAFVGFNRGQLYTKDPEGGLLVRVELDGSFSIAAEGLILPNGSAITPGGHTLLVAETGRNQVIAFAIERNGILRPPRVFAKFTNDTPDGLALDQDGAVWTASPYNNRFVRVLDGGDIVDAVQVSDGYAIACALGGPDRRTLYLAVSQYTRDNLRAVGANTEFDRDPEISQSHGRIEMLRVDVPAPANPDSSK
jgi:sugar lactone lactonase YvrE